MNLDDAPIPAPSAAELAKALAEPLFPINPRKSGFGYYQLKFGQIAYKTAQKLLGTKSKVLSLSTLTMRNNARTIQAQLQQGAKYIIDGGHVHIVVGDKDLHDQTMQALQRMIVAIKKNNVVISLPEEVVDLESAILEGFKEVSVSDDEIGAMDRGEFRDALLRFLDGPDDQVFAPSEDLQFYPNVPPDEMPRIETLIKQHAERGKFLMDYDVGNKTLYLTKLSPEKLKEL